MKFSLYLVSALLLISCVSGHNRHRHRHNQDQLDDLTSEILDYGINFIFDQAADKYGVSADNVEVTKINDIDRKNLDGPITLYWFNVAATNNDDATVKARFGVEYNHETEEMTMGKNWHYDIHYNSSVNEENIFEGSLNEEEDISIDESEIGGGEVEVEVEVEVEEAEAEIELETEVEIETGIDEEGIDDNNEDFQEVPEEEIENDQVIQDVLNDGAAFIFNRAADRFGVSNSSVEITNVDSVSRRGDGQGDWTTYRINIDATNNDDATVEARLTIDHNNETGENIVGPWRYSINYRTFDNEEGGLEEESILEFDMNDSLADIL